MLSKIHTLGSVGLGLVLMGGSLACGGGIVQAATLEPVPPGVTFDARAIIEQAGPAVVGISAAGQHKLAPNESPLDFDDPFFQFFRGLPGFQFRLPGQSPDGVVPFRSQGSGFIISSDGLVLTNAHVVREAKEVIVKLRDRRDFGASVLGVDTATDIAVLRIRANNLPVVKLGDVEQLHVGDPVLAIGSPFGFEQSATHGIVSAKGRSLPGETAVPYIQTDAAVNPGNSGGPLFDANGAVVGINAQIYSQSGGFQGLSFAIPINVALKVRDQIVAKGYALHAQLGVIVQDVSRSLAESFGLGKSSGALVSSVAAHSAAAAAGLRPGDVIMEMNGEVVDRSADLRSRIGLSTPGETVRLKVWRDRAAREISVKLGRADDGDNAQPPPATNAQSEYLGLTMRALTRDELSKLYLEGGLLIEAVTGLSASAGLSPGDILLAINSVPVKSLDQVRKLLDKKPASVALLIQRDTVRIYVAIDLK